VFSAALDRIARHGRLRRLHWLRQQVVRIARLCIINNLLARDCPLICSRRKTALPVLLGVGFSVLNRIC
jgi:hypothetical protein